MTCALRLVNNAHTGVVMTDDVNPGREVLRKLKARLLAEAEQEERNARVLTAALKTTVYPHAILDARTEKAIARSEAQAKELRAQVAEIDRMREALEKIAALDGSGGCCTNEWTEAEAFNQARAIANEALGPVGPTAEGAAP